MYVVMNRIPVQPAFAEAFEERFRQRAGAVDQMPGFVRTLVLRPDNPEDPYVVLTLWESKEAYTAWTQSEAFQQGHARSGRLPREAFRGPNKVETFTAFVDSGDPDEGAGGE
ncbi:MAG: antibiotic biosynthesis monooxygenase [Limnochordales bacterium]|nr:antibiotic biosynthesis monooxygenase [Limnochordales bacterium]